MSSQPDLLYAQIEHDLRQRIISGDLSIGEKIPTEIELCEKYSVSRITVRRAIQNLVDEGILYRLRGRGTFVSAPKREIRKGMKSHFGYHAFSENGPTPCRFLEKRLLAADEKLARKLDIGVGEEVQLVKRLMFEDNLPIGIDEVYIPVSVIPDFLDAIREDVHLYELLEDHYTIQVGVEEIKIDVTIAREDEAKLLSCISGAPLFLLDKTMCAKDGTLVHYSRSLLRGDRASFVFSIQDGCILEG
ncbi:GntR family transcriptional regulator [Olsenella sp. HMSC062G07]|uniref:GntR family transcriptional regulator n=1 Tax=Olsenella sp. HMSC062G07 TaxID=1739330 RepID=UPI0008A5ADE8|nr:GntR family transcriptional regulator [Olsenella sp. HMSC062G07]OFK24145.1 hypothetical protein HMPREF2826_08460 [Olsenella sp. HMSC062G07]